MATATVSTRPAATVAGVPVRLSKAEWLIIANMIGKNAGLERAPHVASLIDRLVRMKMLKRVHVEGAAAPVYACTPLARQFHKAVAQRTASRNEARARRAARLLNEQMKADENQHQA